jgi:hypothetical protein
MLLRSSSPDSLANADPSLHSPGGTSAAQMKLDCSNSSESGSSTLAITVANPTPLASPAKASRKKTRRKRQKMLRRVAACRRERVPRPPGETRVPPVPSAWGRRGRDGPSEPAMTNSEGYRPTPPGAVHFGRLGRASPHVEDPPQVVPRAVQAHLHDVTRDRCAAATQVRELADAGNAASPRREARTERIRNQGQGTPLADGTRLGCVLANARGRSAQLGMGITHVEP